MKLSFGLHQIAFVVPTLQAAQVVLRATGLEEERVALDVWYVDHSSLWLDLKILLRMPLVVLEANAVCGKDGLETSAIPTRVQLQQPLVHTLNRLSPRNFGFEFRVSRS